MTSTLILQQVSSEHSSCWKMKLKYLLDRNDHLTLQDRAHWDSSSGSYSGEEGNSGCMVTMVKPCPERKVRT